MKKQCTYCTCTELTVYIQLSSNFDSCPKRLCEGIGQTLRKDDSCEKHFGHLTECIYALKILQEHCCRKLYKFKLRLYREFTEVKQLGPLLAL